MTPRRDCLTDDAAALRGLVAGVLLALPFWALIALLIHAVWMRL